MKLIFGLGNPGAKYVCTRHNIGFSILDTYASRLQLPFIKTYRSFEHVSAIVNHSETMFIKPLTYMNLSGESVSEALAVFPDIDPHKDILILYDDIALPLGKLRFRSKGSDGGHNGIKSITAHLDSPKFPRLRFGINEPSDDLIAHVLGEFTSEEQALVDQMTDISIESISSWISHGMDKTMNHYNSIDFSTTETESND